MHFQIFPNSLNLWEIKIFEVALLSYFVTLWGLSFRQGMGREDGVDIHYVTMLWQFKDYLRYKTITSKNVSSEAQVKNFLFRRKVMFCSQDIQDFVFTTIQWFTKPVTPWWVLVHETVCKFEYIFWTTTY